MEITYIWHSGFLVETDDFLLVIDYYKEDEKGGELVRLLSEKSEKPLYVLASHAHADHFNVEVLKWEGINTGVKYIFSDDVAALVNRGAENLFFLKQGEEFRDNHIFVKAFGSTDAGVSFLIKTGKTVIFHAGDLNNWHWDEESTEDEVKEAEEWFLREVGELKSYVADIDVVFFPVDIRLGKNYMKGAQQFADRFVIKYFIPMHYGKRREEAWAFEPYASSRGIKFVKFLCGGDSVNLNI